MQRQYCGRTGKLDNCVVSVHLSCVGLDLGFRAMLDGRVYLPKHGWGKQRRQEAKIPERIRYCDKCVIGLDEIKTALANGVALRWITADEGYGCRPGFRDGVATLGLDYGGGKRMSVGCGRVVAVLGATRSGVTAPPRVLSVETVADFQGTQGMCDTRERSSCRRLRENARRLSRKGTVRRSSSLAASLQRPSCVGVAVYSVSNLGVFGQVESNSFSANTPVCQEGLCHRFGHLWGRSSGSARKPFADKKIGPTCRPWPPARPKR